MFQGSHSAEESSASMWPSSRPWPGATARPPWPLREHLGNVERNLRLNPRVADLATALQPDTP
jgi:hypothetical protein